MENSIITDKIKDGIYKFFRLGGANNVKSIENDLENNLQKNSDVYGGNGRTGGYGREYLEELKF